MIILAGIELKLTLELILYVQAKGLLSYITQVALPMLAAFTAILVQQQVFLLHKLQQHMTLLNMKHSYWSSMKPSILKKQWLHP
jgi:hypothetical protein